MAELIPTFSLLQGALTPEDLAYLKTACQAHLKREDSIPSYVLLDRLATPVCRKIQTLIEQHTNQSLYYLNDFYFYSDNAFGAHWHMDTELFTFEDCLNAWMLLSPDEVENPLAFIGGVNDSPSNHYHNVKIDGDDCVFVNYRNMKKETSSLKRIEAEKIDTPIVKVGDILVINPKKFHKTNTTAPKHAIVIKFVVKGQKGVLSEAQVPKMFWSEIALFNDLVNKSSQWDDVLVALRQKLQTPDGRKALSAGFFPEKIDLYRKMVQTL
jgi:hypothetical protein